MYCCTGTNEIGIGCSIYVGCTGVGCNSPGVGCGAGIGCGASAGTSGVGCIEPTPILHQHQHYSQHH